VPERRERRRSAHRVHELCLVRAREAAEHDRSRREHEVAWLALEQLARRHVTNMTSARSRVP
jgi:hypothetical protein